MDKTAATMVIGSLALVKTALDEKIASCDRAVQAAHWYEYSYIDRLARDAQKAEAKKDEIDKAIQVIKEVLNGTLCTRQPAVRSLETPK